MVENGFALPVDLDLLEDAFEITLSSLKNENGLGSPEPPERFDPTSSVPVICMLFISFIEFSTAASIAEPDGALRLSCFLRITESLRF